MVNGHRENCTWGTGEKSVWWNYHQMARSKTKLVSKQTKGKASDSILVSRNGFGFPWWCSRGTENIQNIWFWEDENLWFFSCVFFLTEYGQLKVGIAGFCQLRSGYWQFVLFRAYYFIYIIIYIIYKRSGGSWQVFCTNKVKKVTTYTAELSHGISMLYYCSSAPLTVSLRAVLVSLSKAKQIWWSRGLLWLTNWLTKP